MVKAVPNRLSTEFIVPLIDYPFRSKILNQRNPINISLNTITRKFRLHINEYIDPD